MITTHRGTEARRFVVAVTLIAATVTIAAPQAQQAQQPRFRASVDVIPVDVTVVDGNGLPVLDLTADDFTVTIDGRPRRIVSMAAPASQPAPTSDSPVPTSDSPVPTSDSPVPTSDSPGPTSDRPGPTRVPAAPTEPRPVILVFDQPNTRFGAIREHRDAIQRFVDGLARTDPISVVSLGAGARSIGFTFDREEVRRAVNAAVGGQPYPPINRTSGEETVEVLRRLITELRDIGGAKTMMLVTERLVFDQRRPDIQQLRREAAAARVTVHVLRLNAPRTDASRQNVADSTAPITTSENIFVPGANDPLEGFEGVVAVAAATGGFVFNVVNSADAAFDRVTATLAGYYLLGVESQPIDGDGLPKAIQVTVNRPGVTLSARRFFVAR